MDRNISTKESELNQGRGLSSPLLYSDPKGEIALFYMARFIMDYFSPAPQGIFVGI